MIDINELRRLTQAALAGPDGISLNWIKPLQDFQQKVSPVAVSELLDRLEAAERERDALRAKIEQMGELSSLGELEMDRLEKLRSYFDEWQNQGHETRPNWYDEYIDKRINDLTNVELLELLDTVDLWLKKGN